MNKSIITISITFLIAILIFSCSTESTTVYQLTTSSEPSEAGTVSQSAAEAEEGETITVTANANEHWVFDRWSGDYSGTDNPSSILMDADKSVTALFEKQDYPLTIETEGEGSVSQQVIQPKTTDYPHGTIVELTAIPDEGWELVEWQGDLAGTENPAQITVEGATSVTAVFEKAEYQIDISLDGEGTYSITPEQDAYFLGDEVEITVHPSEGWNFSYWDGDFDGTDNPMEFSVENNISATAILERKEFVISIETVGEGNVSETLVSGTETEDGYLFESLVELTAEPAEGWKFSSWSGDIDSSEEITEVQITSDVSVTAEFEIINPELQLWSGNTRYNWPYSGSAAMSISRVPVPSSFTLREFRLKALGGSFEIESISVTDRNNVTVGSFVGIENGTTIQPGSDINFSLVANRTAGRQSDLLYTFRVKGHDYSFTQQIIFTSN
ncbi:MAG: hypothetical protein EA391_11965 [Balneolaceae bacterium]|nr:MAG: hypothetical protein EA391_11965 [Balneolaceae bacterium]